MTFYTFWTGIISYGSAAAWGNSLCWVVPCPRNSLGTRKQPGPVWRQGCSCQPQGCCCNPDKDAGSSSQGRQRARLVCLGSLWNVKFFLYLLLSLFNNRKQKHHLECLPSPADSSELSLCWAEVLSDTCKRWAGTTVPSKPGKETLENSPVHLQGTCIPRDAWCQPRMPPQHQAANFSPSIWTMSGAESLFFHLFRPQIAAILPPWNSMSHVHQQSRIS